MNTSAATKIARLFERFAPLPNTNLADGWASVFAAPIGSAPFYEGLLGIHTDFRRFTFELELSVASDRAKALYTKAAAKLETFTNVQTFNGITTDQIKKQGDAIDLMFLAADVTQGLPDASVNPITLDTVTADLTELLAELDAIDVDDRLRRFLKFQVGNMLQAIASFDAIGIEGLSRIYGATVSEVTRAWGMKEAKTPSVQGWMVKARSTLKLIGAGVVWVGAVAGGADDAIEHGTSLLEFAGFVEAAGGTYEVPE
jgi:hypothetical protein